jgi:hypothetical protein
VIGAQSDGAGARLAAEACGSNARRGWVQYYNLDAELMPKKSGYNDLTIRFGIFDIKKQYSAYISNSHQRKT